MLKMLVIVVCKGKCVAYGNNNREVFVVLLVMVFTIYNFIISE